MLRIVLLQAAKRCQSNMGPHTTVPGLILPKEAPVVSSRLPVCTLSSSIKGLRPYKHAWQLQALTNPQKLANASCSPSPDR